MNACKSMQSSYKALFSYAPTTAAELNQIAYVLTGGGITRRRLLS